MILACCLDLQVLNQMFHKFQKARIKSSILLQNMSWKFLLLRQLRFPNIMGIILKMLLSLALLTEKILLASEKVHFNVVRQSNMDYFILVINKDEHITSSEFALNHDGARSGCGMKVDLYSLCGKLTRAASDYYHSNKELFDFFQYQLIQ